MTKYLSDFIALEEKVAHDIKYSVEVLTRTDLKTILAAIHALKYKESL